MSDWSALFPFALLTVFLGVAQASEGPSPTPVASARASHPILPIHVTATTPLVASIVRGVVGKEGQVEVLLEGQAGEHEGPSLSRSIAVIQRAKFLFCNGAGLEDEWLPGVLRRSGSPELQPGKENHHCLSESVDLLSVPPGGIDRTLKDNHPLGDPHFLLDPARARKAAVSVASKLIERHPEKRQALGANLDVFSKALEALEKKGRSLAGLKDTAFIGYHSEWAYLAGWLEMRNLGAIEERPGLRPDPNRISKWSEDLGKQKLKLILLSPVDPRAVADRLSKTSRAPVLLLEIRSGYLETLEAWLSEIQGALQKSKTIREGSAMHHALLPSS